MIHDWQFPCRALIIDRVALDLAYCLVRFFGWDGAANNGLLEPNRPLVVLYRSAARQNTPPPLCHRRPGG